MNDVCATDDDDELLQFFFGIRWNNNFVMFISLSTTINCIGWWW